ncbi:molybdate ABC transporter substrate-binding protein [Allorhodopirellula solitaria]|nr:molybdate ABC transporter substrate-binding protein [Allorhodopirellula solitaria]
MNRTIILLAGLLAAVPVLFYLLARSESARDHTPSGLGTGNSPITIYCAASNQAVMEAIVADYRRQRGGNVFVNYGPSQGLLSQIEVSRTGDLFLPADDSYLHMAQRRGLISEMFPIGTMRAVVIVQRGNPKAIHSFDDLLRDDVRWVQANPEAAAIGRITELTWQRLGLSKAAEAATAAYRGNVTEAAADVVIGSADAAIVYDCMEHNYPGLDIVELPELKTAVSQFGVGLLSTSRHPAAAKQFVDYVTSPEHGLVRYREYGFHELPNDRPLTNP